MSGDTTARDNSRLRAVLTDLIAAIDEDDDNANEFNHALGAAREALTFTAPLAPEATESPTARLEPLRGEAMSARDDYPALGRLALYRQWEQLAAALDEIDRLRVGGVAERAVLDAAAAYIDGIEAWTGGEEGHPSIAMLVAAVRAWRGAAPTVEETP